VLLTDSLRHAFTDEVATGFLAAVVDELAPTGLALTLLTTDGRGDAMAARDVAIDGAVVYSCRPTSEARDWLMRRKLPLVFVDQTPVAGIPSVNIDDRGGARAAAQHLIDLGHRNVAVLTESTEPQDDNRNDPLAAAAHPVRQRMLGWRDALDAAGFVPRIVTTTQHRSEALSELTRSLLNAPEPPTAVLCFSDVLALGVMEIANQLGLRVPEDVSVVGFDDTPAASRVTPPLTTVHQDVAAKGRGAVSALTSAMARARSGATGRARHVTLATELVVRARRGNSCVWL
jgi:DNA-binding LacI/PurR family transcriptional regulator